MAAVTEKSGSAQSTPEVQNPTKTFDVLDPITENPKEEEKTDVTTAGATTGTTEPVSSILKKIKRAERFGMPVQLSEEEKRNSRAERFGTGTNTQGSDAVLKPLNAVKKAEELKRKARAERFGLPSESAADKEAKKKARLARFAPAGKPDSAEEDKRKARALRFAKTSPPTLTHANGKGNIESEAAVVGKASGGA